MFSDLLRVEEAKMPAIDWIIDLLDDNDIRIIMIMNWIVE